MAITLGPPYGPRSAERDGLPTRAVMLSGGAERLFISSSTVKRHVRGLLEKLGVKDRAAAVAEAMRRGLLE